MTTGGTSRVPWRNVMLTLVARHQAMFKDALQLMDADEREGIRALLQGQQ
jgi:hypothetical protein